MRFLTLLLLGFTLARTTPAHAKDPAELCYSVDSNNVLDDKSLRDQVQGYWHTFSVAKDREALQYLLYVYRHALCTTWISLYSRELASGKPVWKRMRRDVLILIQMAADPKKVKLLKARDAVGRLYLNIQFAPR